MDPHLIVLLLDFLSQKEIFAKEEVLAAKLNVLGKTALVDQQTEVYKSLGKDPSEDHDTRSKKVTENLNSLESNCSTLLAWIKDNSEEIEKLKKEKKFSASVLESRHNIKPEEVQGLYKYAKAQYESGAYQSASDNLSHYLALQSKEEDSSSEVLSATWGKLAADILAKNWDAAKAGVTSLKELIDSGKFGKPIEQLQQRSWLLHWSLFVYFNEQSNSNEFVELCFQTNYLNAIQTTSPHLLRYLAFAVITNTENRRRSDVENLVDALGREQSNYQDPITNFLNSLLVDFDFDSAQEKVKACSEVLSQDYFLNDKQEAFVESARLFIFETYCRIHKCVDIQMLADKLAMQDKEEAELWIANLIRNAKLDAKIDSATGKVIMSTKSSSVYEQVLEKTKSLHFQSNQLASCLLQE